jgi:hypothetical protein
MSPQVETKNTSSESLVRKLARAVFACGDQNRNPFASTSFRDDTATVWANEQSVMDIGETYDMIEQRQDTFWEYTGDSVFSDRRRVDRRAYRTSLDENELRQE